MPKRQNLYFTDEEVEAIEAAFPNLSFGKAVKTALRLYFLEGFTRVWKGTLKPGDHVADVPGGMVRRVHGSLPNFYVWRRGQPTALGDFVWKVAFVQNDNSK